MDQDKNKSVESEEFIFLKIHSQRKGTNQEAKFRRCHRRRHCRSRRCQHHRTRCRHPGLLQQSRQSRWSWWTLGTRRRTWGSWPRPLSTSESHQPWRPGSHGDQPGWCQTGLSRPVIFKRIVKDVKVSVKNFTFLRSFPRMWQRRLTPSKHMASRRPLPSILVTWKMIIMRKRGYIWLTPTWAYSCPSSLKISSLLTPSFSFFPLLLFFPPFPLFLGIVSHEV